MQVFEVRPSRMVPLVLLCCFICLSSPSLHAQGFVFNNFSSTAGLQLNGSAAVVSPEDVPVLRITPASTFQVGSAWYTTLLPLSNGFSTTFKFQLSGSNAEFGPADGFAFVIQNGCFSNDPSTCGISALDPTAGGTLGYGGSPTDPTGLPGLTNSLAVEFDTYCNGQGDENDTCSGEDVSSANEVGIQSCGTSANTANHSSCNFEQLDLASLFSVEGATASTSAGSTTVTLSGTSYTAAQMQNMVGLSLVLNIAGSGCFNGCNFGLIATADAGTQTLTLGYPATATSTASYAIEPVLADGLSHTVQITYKPPSTCSEVCPSNLTVTLDGVVVLSTRVDLATLGLDGSDDAYVGFTAATADGVDNHDILSWSFDAAQTQTLDGSAQTITFPFDGDTHSIAFTVPAGWCINVPCTVFTTYADTPDSIWQKESANYPGTHIAPIPALNNDGAVYDVICMDSTGATCSNTTLDYTTTMHWQSPQTDFCNSGPGLGKEETTTWENIQGSCSYSADPGPTQSGSSKPQLSRWASFYGVTGAPSAGVTITTPPNGAVYLLNQPVNANYSCTGTFFECAGTVTNGSPIDTSSLGTKTFTAEADVTSGPTVTASSTYQVVAGAVASLSPTSVNFGNIPVGGFRFRILTVTNTGNASLNFTNVKVASVSGGDSDDFFAFSLCPKTLLPTKSCIIFVSFFADADSFSLQSATLTITDNNATGSPQLVPMTATVVKRN